MIRWIGGLMDRVCAVAGAVIFAQAPLFMKQYTQQLISRESELGMQVEAMRNAAGISGKTLDQLIQKFLSNPDPDFIHQGEVMLALLGRWRNLSESLSAMQNSTIWERPFAFAFHLNAEVFSSTLANFTFGIPMTTEGGIYALAGIVVGYGIFAIIRKICWHGFNRVKAKCS